MHKSVTSNTNYSPIVIACSKFSPPWDKCPKKWGLANLKQKTNNVLLPSGCIICFDRFSTRFQEFIVLYYFSAACLILLSPSPFYLTDLKSIQKYLLTAFLTNADHWRVFAPWKANSQLPHTVVLSSSSQQCKLSKLLTFISGVILKHNTHSVLYLTKTDFPA